MQKPTFDFDPRKSKRNKKRHGFDFVEAQQLWDESHVVIPAKNVFGESRYAVVGVLDDRICLAIFTKRGDKVRLISCHRADSRWERLYERHIQEENDSENLGGPI